MLCKVERRMLHRMGQMLHFLQDDTLDNLTKKLYILFANLMQNLRPTQ